MIPVHIWLECFSGFLKLGHLKYHCTKLRSFQVLSWNLTNNHSSIWWCHGGWLKRKEQKAPWYLLHCRRCLCPSQPPFASSPPILSSFSFIVCQWADNDQQQMGREWQQPSGNGQRITFRNNGQWWWWPSATLQHQNLIQLLNSVVKSKMLFLPLFPFSQLYVDLAISQWTSQKRLSRTTSDMENSLSCWLKSDRLEYFGGTKSLRHTCHPLTIH